ncbi:MAG: sulfotransferase [Alphaproteobacteria bacterium]|nr:sulfotransferase [Alphaproteobacteria bacterium]
MKYFLITAMPKSGTTWVQRICRAHPKMHCRAEDQFTNFWPQLRDVVTDYNDLITLRDQQRDNQGVEPLDRGDSVKLFYAMIRVALEKAPEDVVWSGIKELTLSAKGFMRYLPDARIINVIRDPRDIAISALAHTRRVAQDKNSVLDEPSDFLLSEIANHWLKQLELLNATRREFPDRTFDIHYESLIDDFPATVLGMLNFFDLDSTPTTIEALRLETDFTHLSGGRSPGEEDGSSYFRKGQARDWRGVLSSAQIALVNDICGAELTAHGYAQG